MSTVRPTPLLGRLVDLNVLDNQVAGVETLGVGVGLGVLEQAEQELSALDGPAGLADAELLACITTRYQHMSPVSSKYPPMHPRTWLMATRHQNGDVRGR